MMMSPGLRKAALAVHVTASLGWFGAVSVFLALALVGVTSQDQELVRATYRVMSVTTWFVILPLTLTSGLTGIISSLFTRWGLFRYYWVVIKQVITIGMTLILCVHTQPIDVLTQAVATPSILGTQLQETRIQMVIASGATVGALFALTLLSVYKPRGMTWYGQRKQDRG